jgi:hypothetical protein
VSAVQAPNPHFDLELGNHASLGIVACAPRVQEALGKVVLVVPLEPIFVCQEAEEDDCLLQRRLDLVFGFLASARAGSATHRFRPLLEVLIYEQRDVFRGARVGIYERLEGLVSAAKPARAL